MDGALPVHPGHGSGVVAVRGGTSRLSPGCLELELAC